MDSFAAWISSVPIVVRPPTSPSRMPSICRPECVRPASNVDAGHYSSRSTKSVRHAIQIRSRMRSNSPSIACFFHSPTIVWWMLCLLASCAAVSSPRSASRATFALKSAEYRFRLPVIQVHPSQEQTELNLLSDFPGPPHIAAVQRGSSQCSQHDPQRSLRG